MIVVTRYGAAKITALWLEGGVEAPEPTADCWPRVVRWCGIVLDGLYVGQPIEGPPSAGEPVTLH